MLEFKIRVLQGGAKEAGWHSKWRHRWPVGEENRGGGGLPSSCGAGLRELARAALAGRAGVASWAQERSGGLRVWVVGLGWFSFSNFNSISYFYFKQSLNSNENLNSNHTQTIKTMHQHECNTKKNLSL